MTRVRDPSPPFRVTSRGGQSSGPCASFACKVATTARAGCSPIASLAPARVRACVRALRARSPPRREPDAAHRVMSAQPSGIGPLVGHRAVRGSQSSPQGSGRSRVTALCPPSFFRRLRAPVSPRRGAAVSPLASAFFPQRRNLLLLARRPKESFSFPARRCGAALKQASFPGEALRSRLGFSFLGDGVSLPATTCLLTRLKRRSSPRLSRRRWGRPARLPPLCAVRACVRLCVRACCICAFARGFAYLSASSSPLCTLVAAHFVFALPCLPFFSSLLHVYPLRFPALIN